MNILHITDLHFGPYHWAADDRLVLERLNAFNADIVFNTGDMTSDSLPEEFEQAAAFLAKLECPNVVSIMGNHDKYSKRSHEMFRENIYDGGFVQVKDAAKIKKRKVFINPATARLDDYFTEVNYTRLFDINGEAVLVVCLDTNLFQDDQGMVELQILEALKDEMTGLTYDRVLMLAHHSVLATDEDPLINSKRVTDFILEQGVEATFCGHTHELDIVELTDISRGAKFRQFMCGSLSSVNIPRDTNMFCTYENFGAKDEIITVIRMIPTSNGLKFIKTVLPK
jgi:3',5'-cyclic AMP phosphodiesterase CpdA